jgi:glyoxylase-like metal-dependent hydrolase (beta-lactamase superfamily II)
MKRAHSGLQLVLLLGLGLTAAALGKPPDPPAGPKPVLIGDPVQRSNLPSVLAQGKFLPAQSVSALDVSGDGRRIAVTTMAFRHDRNFWLLSDEGNVLWGRYVLPWAPFQVAATPKGGAFATGLAYSRITPPYPTIALFQDEKSDETVLTDNSGERGWLRYGSGDWRTGWLVSALGDQFVRAGDSVFTINTGNGAWTLSDDGGARKLPSGSFPTQRPYRMAASADGGVLALGYMVPDVSRLEKGTLPETFRVEAPPALVTVRATADWKELGSIKPPRQPAAITALPDPAKDFPELAGQFKLRPDAVLPFWVAGSVAVNADGSRIAVTEYAGWLWVRARPAIGRWDPPYHVIPFVPRQRGWLRIVGTSGEEIVRTQLPKDGLFEVKTTGRGDTVWCYPMSWFARGMAGCAWRPADDDARTVLGYDVSRKSWASAWEFPDAVGDLAPHPTAERILVSCWDGKLYLLDAAGKVQTTVALDSPARLQWSKDGRFAVAGTQDGEVLCLDGDGKQRWRMKLPQAELPPLKQPVQRVFEEVPIYQVGRVGPEHAYVGDTWLIKTDQGGILVDTGGTSAIPFTLQRMKSAGVDLKDVRYLLHSHSHGDHCGAGYLWRALGLKVVAPESANFTLAWLMPMLSDYGVWAPRPVDVPLPLKRAGDTTEIALGNLKVKAIFVPGHSFDSVIYALELDGKRVVFTGDIGFDNQQEILHRCWGDVEKAKLVTEVVRTQVIPFKPDFVFRGHSAKRDGTAWLEDLVKRSQEAIRMESDKK